MKKKAELCRVEIYDGCGLTISGMFENHEDAEQYAHSILAPVIHIIKVDENGRALASRL